MDFAQFKAKYQDMIICPLPYKVPDFNYDRLIAWADENRESEFIFRVNKGSPLSVEELKAAALSAKLSFFESYFLLTKGASDASEWNYDFDKHFPEIANFVNELPVVGEKHFGFIRQRPMHEIQAVNPHGVSHIHTDEHGGFGLRFYINSFNNDLYFYGLRDGEIPEFIERRKQEVSSFGNVDIFHKTEGGNPVVAAGVPLAHESFYPTPVKSRLRDPNSVFLLNNIKAAHFVKLESTNKLTFLIQGRTSIEKRYDWARLDKDIQNSLREKPAEFLYYDDLRS